MSNTSKITQLASVIYKRAPGRSPGGGHRRPVPERPSSLLGTESTDLTESTKKSQLRAQGAPHTLLAPYWLRRAKQTKCLFVETRHKNPLFGRGVKPRSRTESPQRLQSHWTVRVEAGLLALEALDSRDALSLGALGYSKKMSPEPRQPPGSVLPIYKANARVLPGDYGRKRDVLCDAAMSLCKILLRPLLFKLTCAKRGLLVAQMHAHTHKGAGPSPRSPSAWAWLFPLPSLPCAFDCTRRSIAEALPIGAAPIGHFGVQSLRCLLLQCVLRHPLQT